ncbi:MAG: sodium-independent anion transporter, partial [Gemmatimonadetes bacterium]|nr:sodium-independent anion transporter [Gemmatimonadota bacterium]
MRDRSKTFAFEPQPICASADAGHTVWFQVTPVVSGPMSFTTCHPNTTYDTVLQAWTGPCTGPLTPIACNDDDKRNPMCDNACGTGLGSTVSLDASAGQTYFFQVGSFDNNADGCALCLGVALTIENVFDLDTTAADTLDELRSELASTGVELLMARVHGPVQDMLLRSGLEESIGPDRIYATVRAGVEDFLKRHG